MNGRDILIMKFDLAIFDQIRCKTFFNALRECWKQYYWISVKIRLIQEPRRQYFRFLLIYDKTFKNYTRGIFETIFTVTITIIKYLRKNTGGKKTIALAFLPKCVSRCFTSPFAVSFSIVSIRSKFYLLANFVKFERRDLDFRSMVAEASEKCGG